MNIIIVSNIELDESNAAGNTFSNWMSEWPNTNIASIYCRGSKPYNKFCSQYYSVSPISIAKKFFTPQKIGTYFTINNKDTLISHPRESSLVHSSNSTIKKILYLIQEFLVSSKIWQNRRYERFVKSFNPDIVFYFVKSESFIYNNVAYIKRITNAKSVGFIADDVYSLYTNRGGFLYRIYRRRFKKLIAISDKLYGASAMLCQEYGKNFNVSLTPLYKGCDLRNAPKEFVNNPIKIVYAGNLLYGRDVTLEVFAKTLKKINKNSSRAILDIYSGSNVSQETLERLNIPGTSNFKGKKEYNEIKKILHDADIVLHVESFERKHIEYVHLSYSTKISDCLQSGSMMMVVGPEGIASVEEARSIEGAVVIDSMSKLETSINNIVNNPTFIIQNAKQSYFDALGKFPIEIIRKKLHGDFSKLLRAQ